MDLEADLSRHECLHFPPGGRYDFALGDAPADDQIDPPQDLCPRSKTSPALGDADYVMHDYREPYSQPDRNSPPRDDQQARSSDGSPASQGVSPSSSADSPSTTTHTDTDAASPASSRDFSQVLRVLRAILLDEFDVRLGSCEPPQDMSEAVLICLDRISLALQTHRNNGMLAPFVPSVLVSQDSTTTVFSPPRLAGGQPASSSRKRGSPAAGKEDGDDMQDEGLDEEGGGACVASGDTSNPKKIKTEQYPCPFRKRNPLRFNVRQYVHCAKGPFQGMTDLKKHIVKYHGQQQVEYRLDQGAPQASADERLTDMMCQRLRRRTEHFEWTTLWHALFPDDRHIPEPDFELAVELHEVCKEYDEGTAELQHRLSAALEPLAITTSSWAGLDGHLASQLQDLCVEVQRTVNEHIASDMLDPKDVLRAREDRIPVFHQPTARGP
ncbi:hypothetical protein OQA88_11580 [Cercophora sp. LCS_1]